jgi:hypothetical protein
MNSPPITRAGSGSGTVTEPPVRATTLAYRGGSTVPPHPPTSTKENIPYKEHGEAKWCWSVNTSPHPAPPPNNGLAKSLEEAKEQFKQRYEEMKAQGVRPFSDG